MFAMFNNQLFWYNSCVKLIISLLLVCAPFAWLAVETFVLAPSLELGCDTNADGDLDFDEADLVFGCDCSNWYSADLRTGETYAASTNALTIGRGAFSPLWNRAKFIRRGGGESVAAFSLDVENTRFDIMIR